MPSPPFVLLASARPAGDTAALVRSVFANTEHALHNLLDAPLYPYSYAGHYPPDDAFAAVARQLVQHEVVVFATPVYWYAMSGLLKTFFDRLTDLVTVTKPLGRQLRGKRTFLLAVGEEATLPLGFEEPFRLTARYLDMEFGGSLYYSKKEPPTAEALAESIQAFLSCLATSSSHPSNA
jgi:NAD(P)H-dependent FMN reductase